MSGIGTLLGLQAGILEFLLEEAEHRLTVTMSREGSATSAWGEPIR
jgi:hypothetical protein